MVQGWESRLFCSRFWWLTLAWGWRLPFLPLRLLRASLLGVLCGLTGSASSVVAGCPRSASERAGGQLCPLRTSLRSAPVLPRPRLRDHRPHVSRESVSLPSWDPSTAARGMELRTPSVQRAPFSPGTSCLKCLRRSHVLLFKQIFI